MTSAAGSSAVVESPVDDDELVAELRRRRDIAIDNARSVIGRPGVDDGASLFSNLYAAKVCDEALALLGRLAEPTR